MVEVRKLTTIVELVEHEAGLPVDPPLRRVAVAAVVRNPCAGRYETDLSSIVELSRELGERLARLGLPTVFVLEG